MIAQFLLSPPCRYEQSALEFRLEIFPEALFRQKFWQQLLQSPGTYLQLPMSTNGAQ